MLHEASTTDDGTDVWILPAHLDGTIGQYRARDVYAAKALRTDGVSAQFLHGSADRRFLHEHSAGVGYVIALGVASNMTWDSAKAIWSYVAATARDLVTPDKPNVRLHVALIETPTRRIENLTIEGPLTEATQDRFIGVLMGTGEHAE